jgi:isopentenyl-diphosphate Delta-isomerase
MEQVVLVNEKDEELGVMNKLEAHERGLLHRAFSVFIFNTNGELFLQRRAMNKYHSGGLWSNTCCSHQRPGEDTLEAGKRRLQEEMGLACELKHVFSFHYHVAVEHGVVENEMDYVLVGVTNQLPVLNENEVMEWKIENTDVIMEAVKKSPEKFSYWFPICFSDLYTRIQNDKNILKF